ncbi:hypothetical protein [Streptomyces lonarensis]|uniref:Uncharacterized protein n=1 Tax=Streptomyces lonarensis TaxID=700599 RepID=A0A7X6HXE8_9ACTN|nr:hypothetical protein [Streptomyces lonarensis]NJQ04290.1 hypothetical protein [Streptomyces lonarensis]
MARAKIRVESSFGGIGQLARGGRLQGEMERRAARVRDAARSAAPEMQEGEIRVESRGSPAPRRARAVVTATHAGVLHAEAKYAFLRRSMDAAG